MKMAGLIERYRQELEEKYGHLLLPQQRNALESMLRCQTPSCGETLMLCTECDNTHQHSHSCGHRSCPQCQNHTTTEWLFKQQSKLLPVRYYLITFTLPSQLRSTAYLNQKKMYGALFKAAVNAIKSLAGNPRHLGAEPGMTAVLHTHSRRLEKHPHIHIIIPCGGIIRNAKLWKQGSRKYMFPVSNLKTLFREEFLACMREEKISYPKLLHKIEWVVNIKAAGDGEPAMKYLSKYLYRGVIQERNILSDENGIVTFKYLDAETNQYKTRSLSGAHFLLLVLQHVLPKRFRRTRDFGFHHGNARKTFNKIQLALHHYPPLLEKPIQPKLKCRSCGATLVIAPRKLYFHTCKIQRNKGSPP